MITNLVRTVREHVTARVAPVIKRIIEAEVKARGLKTTTDFIELAVLQAANSPEARRLMLDEVKGDPKIAAILTAFGVNLPANEAPKKK